MADSEQLRVCYEGVVKHNPSNIDAVNYLALWHLERHSFQQARKYFGHLASLKEDDPNVWLCLSVCCAMAEEFDECSSSLKRATSLIRRREDDVRIRFCYALLGEKRKDYSAALDGYCQCLDDCNVTSAELMLAQRDGVTLNDVSVEQSVRYLKELKGEIMLRIAVIRKETGNVDQAIQMCTQIVEEQVGDPIRANALCLKGLLHEVRGEFPQSEVVYRAALQIMTGHSTALERLGRVYLRYRETIPAAVQCFFKSVETNPSNHVAWYLLGRCYMATAQYSDACEAYNRAINLNPNDAQVWCSLGVLYYAFGQYREALGMLARALKLDATMADAWYNVGALYDMCDQPEDAQQAYLKARENGLADRFARAGMGINPLAMQAQPQGLMNPSLSIGGSQGSSSLSNISLNNAAIGMLSVGNNNSSNNSQFVQMQRQQQVLDHPSQQPRSNNNQYNSISLSGSHADSVAVSVVLNDANAIDHRNNSNSHSNNHISTAEVLVGAGLSSSAAIDCGPSLVYFNSLQPTPDSA